MAVPVRDDGTPGPTRRLIIFVHGFNSSARTWRPLRALLERDAAITAEFDLQEFSYETAVGALPIVRRLPTLDEAGKSLAAELTAAMFDGNGNARYIDVTLVGHSMGGLIIQSGVLNLLTPTGSTQTLHRIRQVVLFATPNLGSTTLGRFRAIVAALIANPQERALRLFSEESTRIHEAIRDRVIFAKRRSLDEYPIPFYCFWGRTDAVVPAASARGHFPGGEPLPGDHFAVHAPATADAPAYRQFVDVLRHPHGHPNIWEVEQFSMRVKIGPVAPGTSVTAQHGTRERVVVHDNVASVHREVRFSSRNTCREPYVLKYGTRNGGWVVPRLSGPHITPADKVRLYEDNGCDAHYEISPGPSESATLSLKVYKGFDEGHRDYHMHLGRSTCFRRIHFEVDLSEYRQAGWHLVAPRLYFHPTDPGDHALCGQREFVNPDPPTTVDPAGSWKWELDFVTEGVVDIAWDVQPAPHVETPARVALAPGEHAVFGYGSLLSVASLERTLGRSYTGPFLPCAIEGWRRRWNVSMPNETFVYRDKGEWVTPPRIFYLNVEPRPGSSVNGVLFVVKSDELTRLDAREWIYDRVDVTSQLHGTSVEGGAAWVYQGKPEYVSDPPASPQGGAVRRTYVDILDTGHRAMGAEFLRAYERSTDALPLPIVVDDVRRDDAGVG